MRRRRLQRGLTLVEAVTASTVSVMVLFGVLAVFMQSTASWAMGQSKISSESAARTIVRKVADEVREAMILNVDADGMGVSYVLPNRDNNGDFVRPVVNDIGIGSQVSDGVTRRIYLQGTDLMVDSGGTPYVLARNVRTTDPTDGDAAYRIFDLVPGSSPGLSVTVVTNLSHHQTGDSYARQREIIYLRNAFNPTE